MSALHDAIAPHLVTKHPWQLAYATSDTAQAIKTYGELYNCPKFWTRDPFAVRVSTPKGPGILNLLISFAYLGDVCIEFVEPLLEGDSGIYSSVLPEEGFGLVIHHLGYLIGGEMDDWRKFRSRIPDDLVLLEGGVGDDRRFLYLDTRAQLGHYIEYVWFRPEHRDEFEASVPRN